MKLITTAKEMSEYSFSTRSSSEFVGFVPTMGALHLGHISLIKTAKAKCENVVVSVFVNPTQFNDSNDLQNYPRTFESDRKLLENEGVDVMFFPSANEIYPSPEVKHYEMDGLDDPMEGPNRPGHFNGVVQVVTRLFELVKPNVAFFGEKDFQQLAVIRHMTQKLGYDIEIVGCPTEREASGLAMSSRNIRLSNDGRKLASSINLILLEIKNQLALNEPASVVLEQAIADIDQLNGITLEYLELVNPQTLQPVTDDSAAIQACIALYIEEVRLIDNMRVK
ncbi:MAG: pantoate--beta-alanine ligase [Flavobacteriales bacterium]|nr:pantoate--beta-alanine ligase [Flavobacteriales bacterium]